MRMLILYKIILPCSLFFVMLSAAQAQTSVLKIQMDNFKEDGKKVWVALYQNEATFLGPNIFIGTSVIVKDGKATATFEDIPYGTYAASCFYDTNENGKLDTNFFGIPNEPFAFSNNVKPKFSAPKFIDAGFIVQNPAESIKISF